MKPICPDCKSKQVLYRRTTNTYYCRRCGWEWSRKKQIKKILPLIIAFLLIPGCAFATETPDWDRLVVAVIQVESNGDPNAISPAGAIGLMQITRIVLKEWNNNHSATPDENIGRLFEPRFNVEIGTWYLKRLFHHYKCTTIEEIAMAYNFGITRCKKINFDLSKTCRETRNYVKKIKELYYEN